MAIYTKVGVGAAANDNTGDPIRTAFQTLNANFAALDTTYAVSSTLIIGDDPANIGTPAGFETTIGVVAASGDSITIAPDVAGNLVIGSTTWVGSITTALNTDLTIAPNGTGNLILDADLVTTLTNTDLTITPNGTGDLVLSGTINHITTSLAVDTIVSETAATNITITPDGAGTIVLGKATAITAALTVDDIVSTTNVDITMAPNGTGEVVINSDRIRINTPLTPGSSKGTSGDTQGDVAWDATNLYVCYATWTNGTPDIWARTPHTDTGVW